MKEIENLTLPGLRAQMGDWRYYITFMRMKDIAARIQMAEDIHPAKRLREYIQTKITSRSESIKDYLLKQQQRLFNSIIVGIYGGSPQWHEMALEAGKRFDISPIPQGSLGALTLEGSETLFAIDGQHRVAAIKEAVLESSKLNDEEVSVIFIAHKKDSAGMERTRRLFATLNRYAKPVSLMEIIALDEDDAIAIITRDLLDKYSLFSEERIAITKGKQIPRKYTKSLTTVIVLYEVLDFVLADMQGKKKQDFKRFRPDDELLKKMYKEATKFWDLMVKHFAPLQDLKKSLLTDNIANKYRHENGGNLLFRPVGLLSIARAIEKAKKSGYPVEQTIKKISLLNLEITEKPWIGLLWEGIKKRMITVKENQQLASLLMLYMIGYDLKKFNISEENLRQEYASKLSLELEKAKLPPKVS